MGEKVIEYSVQNGVVMISRPHKSFSDVYLKVREKEGRIYTDDQVASLPVIEELHPHAKEWKLREKSAQRFVTYLNKNKSIKKVMEIGCGNGWFSNYMATHCEVQVCGLDLNLPELEQAARVFDHPNVYFTYGDIFANAPFQKNLDVIVLNSVVQYFPDLSFLFRRLSAFLKPGGEIHILDSPFYSQENIYKARLNTMQYYKELGFPSMSVNYFHHSIEEVKSFDVLYYGHSNRLYQLVNWNDSPFMWLKLRK